MSDQSNNTAPEDDWSDPLRRRAAATLSRTAVDGAVQGGCGRSRARWLAADRSTNLVDEFLAWERDIDRNGIPGLRSTRYQIYRDTDTRRN